MRSASRPLCNVGLVKICTVYPVRHKPSHAEDHPSHYEDDGKYVHVSGPSETKLSDLGESPNHAPQATQKQGRKPTKKHAKERGPSLCMLYACMAVSMRMRNVYGKMRWVMYERMCLR